MTREKIIKLAREAGLMGNPLAYADWYPESLERFAALVAAHVRETEFKPDWNNYRQGLVDGAAAEREAIAQSLDKQADLACDAFDRKWAQEMAAAVRARGETK